MPKQIPVYLFVGQLESGKTKFIQETMEDPNFDSGDKTLLLVCEEGEVEYDPVSYTHLQGGNRDFVKYAKQINVATTIRSSFRCAVPPAHAGA